MSLRDILRSTPSRFNFFRLFREYERAHPGKPRIGENIVTRDEYIRVAQDPFMEFPASNVTTFTEGRDGQPDTVSVRFLSYFGPQGPLPLSLTEEVTRWRDRHNDAFLRFADIFGTRFYHILFRAWGAARRISQFDRPDNDRYRMRLGAIAGIPRAPADDPPDQTSPLARIDVAGLICGRVRSPNRLQQVVESTLRVDVEIEEFVPLWVDFEDEDRSRLGAKGSSLGMDLRLGSRVQTVSDKIRINVRTQGGEDYDRFLPGRPGYIALTDLVRGYLGPAIDIEIAPSMPASALPSVRLGSAGAIGLTSWVAPNLPADDAGDVQIQAATFVHSAFHPRQQDETAHGRPTHT